MDSCLDRVEHIAERHNLVGMERLVTSPVLADFHHLLLQVIHQIDSITLRIDFPHCSRFVDLHDALECLGAVVARIQENFIKSLLQVPRKTVHKARSRPVEVLREVLAAMEDPQEHQRRLDNPLALPRPPSVLEQGEIEELLELWKCDVSCEFVKQDREAPSFDCLRESLG